ncbi:MAG TPA: DNA methyltransferase [Polyangiaceae bacterium]|nr:DNA methyltransferase [Polyangiaceae bacterium]
MQGRDKKQRRALSHIGGPVAVSGGSADLARALEASLGVTSDVETREHVHGFHSYPARLHPVTARRLVEQLSRVGDVVLDPFCGSGTVLVEGRLAKRRVVGVDANPLAIELAWLKTLSTTEAERADIVFGARKIGQAAEERRRRKAGATRRYGPDDVALFDPHVLLELDGLRAGIEATSDPFVRRTLWLALSSILVKVSRRPGDTARMQAPRRLAGGFALRLFFDKVEELARRLAEFRARLPHGAPPATVMLGDARRLAGVSDGSVHLAVTSPPYPGNYDYLEHHAVRLRWLGLDATAFDTAELGARRHLERLPDRAARERWATELSETLSAIARVLTEGGRAVLILADSVVRQRALYADELVRQIAPRARLRVAAIASQERPHFHAPSARAFDRAPRREHAIVVERASDAAKRRPAGGTC